MFLAIVLAFAATFAVSFPVDWARRRGTALLASASAVLSIAGIMTGAFVVARLGVLDGFAGVVVLVLTVVHAGGAGDAVATRLWGPARYLA